jgi:DNA-binding MarR family transcriptional regulator
VAKARAGTRLSTEREELVRAADAAGRALSTAAVLYHGTLAELSGLSPTEWKALDLIQRLGPVTAGVLARESGLAPASVTGLITRLERKGFARRLPNPADGRSVLVEVVPERLGDAAPVFDDFLRSLHDLYEEFSDDELRRIVHFTKEAARRQHEATRRLPPSGR